MFNAQICLQDKMCRLLLRNLLRNFVIVIVRLVSYLLVISQVLLLRLPMFMVKYKIKVTRTLTYVTRIRLQNIVAMPYIVRNLAVCKLTLAFAIYHGISLLKWYF